MAGDVAVARRRSEPEHRFLRNSRHNLERKNGNDRVGHTRVQVAFTTLELELSKYRSAR